jgi:nucleoside-diphosphate-sugar epimerase
VLALTRDAADATNVATGRPRTVLDMARALADRLGVRAEIGMKEGMTEFSLGR